MDFYLGAGDYKTRIIYRSYNASEGSAPYCITAYYFCTEIRSFLSVI